MKRIGIIDFRHPFDEKGYEISVKLWNNSTIKQADDEIEDCIDVLRTIK